MGDWSILGRFLTEVQNHSTVIGKIWLTMLLIFRILLVTLVGDAVYSDEQSKFTCNTLQPGCNNVCYDTFAPVSHLRFWVFQIVLVSTPSIFYICVDQSLLEEDLREVGKDPTELSSQVLLTYIIHVVLRSIMEIAFLVGQYYLFGFEVPQLFRCETYPCPNRTDCFVSRATEKTIFLNFMFSISLGCFILNIVELHYLGYIKQMTIVCA
uniref:Gap junction protein n=1 Tax=Hucho hucho TaxID=62062 RepID=A0A4W5KE72_9TELE